MTWEQHITRLSKVNTIQCYTMVIELCLLTSEKHIWKYKITCHGSQSTLKSGEGVMWEASMGKGGRYTPQSIPLCSPLCTSKCSCLFSSVQLPVDVVQYDTSTMVTSSAQGNFLTIFLSRLSIWAKSLQDSYVFTR